MRTSQTVAAVMVALIVSVLGHAQQKGNIDPLELVRQASKNEIRASNVQFYKMFRDTTEYKDHSITKEIVRTKQGGLTTTLLINGRPLTAEERQKENESWTNSPTMRTPGASGGSPTKQTTSALRRC